MSNPIVHWEFWSEDPGRCAEFYEKAFGWSIRAIPELDYHLVQPDSERGIEGGIMKPQQGPWPAKLALYIDVEDLAAARANIVEAGGTIVLEEKEIPGVGHLCLFQDPDGRLLGCWKQAPKPG